MPLSKKGKKIMKSMKEQYGSKKGESVFYASKNKGAIKGVEKKKDGGSMKKPPRTPPEKDSPIFQEKGLREKLKERGPEMMEKYFSKPREKTISLAKGGMTKKDKDFGKGNPTFPGKPSGPPPVKGPSSQGIKNYKNGGIAKGCGKVMNDRRKLTKYY